jgi:hypothetical protein
MTMREPLKALIAQMRWSGIERVLDEELDLAERKGTPVSGGQNPPIAGGEA